MALASWRRAGWFALLLVVVVSAGCVSKTVDGQKTILTFEWWVPLSAILGGAIAAPAGWLLRESIARLAWGLIILGPLAVIMGFSLFTDRSEVDPQGYKIRMGIFGSASYESRFDDLSEISFTTRRGRRGSTSHYLVCHKKSGGSDQISLGNSISKRAAEVILEHAAAKGVPIQPGP